MRQWSLLVGVALAVAVAGCGAGDEGGGSGDETAADGQATADPGDTTTEDDETEESTDDAAGQTTDDGQGTQDTAGGGGARASVVIQDETYEATDPIECRIGAEGSPDEREFLGTSADGTVRISIVYFAEEQLQGLSGLDVDIEGAGATGGELTWSTLFAAEPSFEIDVRPDGAEGSANVGSLNLARNTEDGEVDTTAEWSFTC